MLFILAGLSLFVGNFPPSPKQVKGVFSEYQKMMKIKEHVMNQYADKDPADLVEAMEKQQLIQRKRLAMARGSKTEIETHDEAATLDRAIAAVETNVDSGVDPNSVNEQLFQLRSEVARLHQRIIELENARSAQGQSANVTQK